MLSDLDVAFDLKRRIDGDNELPRGERGVCEKGQSQWPQILDFGLRRGVTTNLAEAGVLEQTAMEFTGNKDIATHRAYRQLTLTNLKNAAKKLEEQTAK